VAETAPRALLGAARRLGGLLAVIGGITVALSLLVGLALDSSPARAVPTGLYVVGSFLLVTGVFSGVRGPLRPKGGDEGRDASGALFGVGIFSQGIRTATPDERRDAHSTTWLFLTLGLLLIVLAVAIDSRASLV
jgi:hypothetical protein